MKIANRAKAFLSKSATKHPHFHWYVS